MKHEINNFLYSEKEKTFRCSCGENLYPFFKTYEESNSFDLRIFECPACKKKLYIQKFILKSTEALNEN